MKEYKIPVQSLIDHIKTATDVDPWAKEMAEELLKEQEAVVTGKGAWIRHGEPPQYVVECSRCGHKYFNHALQPFARYCSGCGAKMESWILDDQTETT